ncbi:short chain dehydrogenase [Plectosphaerella cucumerina]|uniref:Short chain dehydrogenase n=1 Tax=Plectosphaerella cucumerina TaxID=40658 RepID=A0A8K0TGB2_9PEZI|nr:short chain dehydrogenase [Plectosphaerella cucumerina]
MPLPYRKVLITGASSGIGLALTERLIASNIFVIAVARRHARLTTLLTHHGPSKLAIEPLDISDLQALPAFTSRLLAAHPDLDCIILNAGLQRTLDFTSPSSSSPESLASVTEEMTTNYLSPLHTSLLFLPHLRARAASGLPAALILVSSGLALVPIPRCPNYCASKAALHSLAWQIRSQLADDAGPGSPVRVIEIIPPAVQTELHTVQGLPQMGMPLDEFLQETWDALEEGKEDEIIVGQAKGFAHVDVPRKEAYENLRQVMKSSGNNA